MRKAIKGFSKLSKEAKIEWITDQYFNQSEEAAALLRKYWHEDAKTQKLHDEFIENTISNFYTPFGVAPNFKIDGKLYAIPMAIEESSVVAAASKSIGWKEVVLKPPFCRPSKWDMFTLFMKAIARN